MILFDTLGEKVVGESCPVGGHGVGRCDSAQSHGAFVGAFVAHHSYALHGKEYHSGLPYRIVEAMVAETLYEYGIGLLQHGHLFRSDVAENSDCQPRPGTDDG